MHDMLIRLTGLTAARFIGAVAAFISTLLITRHFGADVLSTFAVCISAAGATSVIMPLGMQSLIPLVVSRSVEAADRNTVQSILSAGRRAIIMFVVFTLVIGTVWLYFGPAHLSKVELQIFFSVVVLAPLMALMQLHAGALNGLQQHASGQLPDTLLKPILMLLMLISVLVLTDAKSIFWILGSLMIALITASSLQLRALHLALESVPHDPSIRNTLTQWWKHSASWLSISLFWDYHIELLMLVAATVAQPIEVAILYISFRIRVLCGFGIKSIYSVFQPKIYAANSKNDLAGVQDAVAGINSLSFTYACLAMGGLWLVGPWVLSMFETEFGQYGYILLTISSVMLIRSFFGPAISVLAANGMQRSIALVLFIGLLISVIGSLWLYPLVGIIGIAASYAISSAFASAIMWALVKQKIKIDTGIWAIKPFSGKLGNLPTSANTSSVQNHHQPRN